MTPLEEFKAKVRAGELHEALAIAMSEAIELKITTVIADSQEQLLEDASQPGYRMRTRINIVDGEVENEIGKEFINNPAYAELQKFHFEQITQGREILLNNLANLQSMFAMLQDTQSELTKIAANPEDKLLPEEQ